MDETGGVIQDLAVKYGFVKEIDKSDWGKTLYEKIFKTYQILIEEVDGCLYSCISYLGESVKSSTYKYGTTLEQVINDCKWEIDNLIKNPEESKQEVACEENFTDLLEETLEKVDEAIAQALLGKTKSRGSFSKYISEELE